MRPGRSSAPRILPLAVFLALCLQVEVRAATRYVDLSSLTPAPPYTSWDSAASSIQDAIDFSRSGDLVLVTNGVYESGGRSVCGKLHNRVALTMPLTVRSVNGPDKTVIRGYQVPGFIHTDRAVRCAYLTNGALLSGFTLSGGATRAVGVSTMDQSGGGVWCESPSAVVSNCIIRDNRAHFSGGGAYQGTLKNCIVATNSAVEEGGGACQATLIGCVILGNQSSKTGGGAADCILTNCTVAGNAAKISSGGVAASKLLNCIAYYNQAPDDANWSMGFVTRSCTRPLPFGGIGNLTNEPLFLDLSAGNLRLQSNSPCINSGLTSTNLAQTDLDGLPRVAGITVDMGAYEFQHPTSVISYAWLQQYGFALDGSADYADPDGDGANNWQEWHGGTNPRDAQSAPRNPGPPRPITTAAASP